MRCLLLSISLLLSGFWGDVFAWQQPTEAPESFSKENLVAWCIVPFDAKNRDPAERAAMVSDLGLKRVAYDWRKEHVATFEQEILEYKKHGIEYFAFWSWHDDMAPLIKKHGIQPQIWRTCPSPNGDTQADRVRSAAAAVLPFAQKADELGLQFGLYNHGGWGGKPDNLIAVCNHLRSEHDLDNVGIVYNFHHAHDDIGSFAESLQQLKPNLLCLNINGMADADKVAANPAQFKILSIGHGKHERAMIATVVQSGYAGPIGILGHRKQMDVRVALQENLDGLEAIFGRGK